MGEIYDLRALVNKEPKLSELLSDYSPERFDQMTWSHLFLKPITYLKVTLDPGSNDWIWSTSDGLRLD